MSDRYVKVTRNGCLSNIFGSIIGAFIGVLLFFGSFVGLWWNEGRINMATVAEQSTPISAASVDAGTDGKLVALSGTLTSPETLGDNAMFQPGRYIALDRRVEMFAWVEESSTETDKEIGGGSTTTTVYRYDRKWTTSPSDSRRFHESGRHYNPPMAIEGETFRVAQAQIGAYHLDMSSVSLPDGNKITLNSETIRLGAGQRIEGGYVFMGQGSVSSPQVGDLRISYSAVPNNMSVTAFGRAQGDQLVTYVHSTGDELYRVFDRDRDAAIKQLGDEYTFSLWLFRLFGFLAMWIGLSMMFNPISAFANIIPLLGDLTGWVIGLVMFVVALVLTILTIIIAAIANSIWLALLVAGLLLGGAVLLGRVTRRPTPAPAM